MKAVSRPMSLQIRVHLSRAGFASEMERLRDAPLPTPRPSHDTGRNSVTLLLTQANCLEGSIVKHSELPIRQRSLYAALGWAGNIVRWRCRFDGGAGHPRRSAYRERLGSWRCTSCPSIAHLREPALRRPR